MKKVIRGGNVNALFPYTLKLKLKFGIFKSVVEGSGFSFFCLLLVSAVLSFATGVLLPAPVLS